jgi:gliding motility-associated-like protein
VLTVITAEGCIAADAINVTVFKGSAIYVPTAFTPNNDRLNDELKPNYYGIKTLDYFIVYNRWGEKVFETKEMSKGWDAKINGVNQASGTFVWVVQATDYVGQKLKQKGAVTIIR